MADPTDYFVDPSVAPGGAGTDVDPWDKVDVALAAIVRDAADGDQINVVSDSAPGITTGTDDVTTAVMTLVAYGAPAADAPLIIRGCSRDPTTGLPVANNGGIGGMDGDAGGWSIYEGNAGATDYVHFIDMHLHNTAAAQVARLGDFSSAIACEIDTSTGNGLRGDNYCRFYDNYVHDVGLRCMLGGDNADFAGNYIEAMAAGSCIFLNGLYGSAQRNICVATVVGVDGIVLSASRAVLDGNSIFSSAAGTGAGFLVDANNHDSIVIRSNLIEGFSGAGGSGIDFANLLRHVNLYANNSFYDNLLDEDNRGDFNYEADNDLAMAASPFLKEGALSFANRFTYFKPQIPVRGRAFPNGCRFDRGGVQVRLAVERTIPATTITTIPEREVLDPLTD